MRDMLLKILSAIAPKAQTAATFTYYTRFFHSGHCTVSQSFGNVKFF